MESQNVEFLMKLLDKQAEEIKQLTAENELLREKLAEQGAHG
jgi:hypothetical protein